MIADAPSTVGVVITTYKRPDRLRNALNNLLATSAEGPEDWRLGVVVVDDDPSGSAEPTVREFSGRFQLPCLYVRSGSGNISVARNKGLETALSLELPGGAGFDWVASLDDDVVVRASWFSACARAVSDGRHTAVTAPLIKDFSAGPAWLRKQPFDQIGILRGADGEDAFVCATGNNWVQARFLRDHHDLRFDPELGKSGGEDMDFFYRAVAAGLRPVFCARASVIEPEPPARCTYRYQMRRAFWLGLLEARVSLRLGLASRSRLLARMARRAVTLGGRQLDQEARQSRGLRFKMTVLGQCAGLLLGCLGVMIPHR